MDLDTVCDRVNALAEEFIATLTKVTAKDIGLDIRSGYELFVGDDCIAVSQSRNRSLAYYGGFEYVDSEHRVEIGNYVIYKSESRRVREHINTYKGIVENEDEDEDAFAEY